MTTTLEKVRSEQGLTMSALAQAAGVHRRTIARAESGRAPGLYMTRLRIAKALGMTPEELFEGDRTAA